MGAARHKFHPVRGAMFIVIRRNQIPHSFRSAMCMNAARNIDDFALIVELEDILFFKIDFEFL